MPHYCDVQLNEIVKAWPQLDANRKSRIMAIVRLFDMGLTFERFGVPATRRGEGLPERPGVYFVWCGPEVVYIGQTICLMKRVRIRRNQPINPGETLSWIACPRCDLDFIEHLCIGLFRPSRNGRSRSQRKG
jgi:hypothetical protein